MPESASGGGVSPCQAGLPAGGCLVPGGSSMLGGMSGPGGGSGPGGVLLARPPPVNGMNDRQV